MRALNIHGVGDVRLDPKVPPIAAAGDAIVRIRACGICGSDLSYIKRGGLGGPQGGVTPIGHEAAGEIVALGGEIAGLEVGQRVIINPMNTPSFIGSGGPEGAFSDEVRVAAARAGDSLLPIPDDLPYDIAALAEPMAVALHGINRLEAKAGEKIVVFGCGPIGLGMVLWLADRGVTDIVAVDMFDERLERARDFGASAVINAGRENVAERLMELHGSHTYFGTPRSNTDGYIDAAGAPGIIADVVRIGKFHARLVVTASYGGSIDFNIGAMLVSELSVTTAMGYPTEMPVVVAALPRLAAKLSALISHSFAFDDIMEGLRVAGTPQSAKVMVTFAGDLQ